MYHQDQKDFNFEKSVFHCLFVSKRGDVGHHGRFQSRELSQGDAAWDAKCSQQCVEVDKY